MTTPINTSVPALGLPIGVDRQPRPADADTATPAAPVRTPVAPAGIRQATPTSEAAPTGIDPELWSVLTTEERAFFARAQDMGPLTYGRRAQSSSQPPAVRLGGRVDVKV